jgi:two-component system chemotaxis response regulator CheY
MNKIIFIDSSKTVLMNIENFLEDFISSGVIEAVFYENPEHFLEHLQKNKDFNILFTAMNMVEMNGIDMIKKAKDINILDDVKIIALTTENSEEMIDLAKENGFYGWVTKPFSRHKLTSIISKVIEE